MLLRWDIEADKINTTRVEEEFKVESTLDIMAEINPANTSPTSPAGNAFNTMVGYTISGFSIPLYKLMAIAPGTTMMNKGINFKNLQ